MAKNCKNCYFKLYLYSRKIVLIKTIKEHHKLSFETIFTDSLSFYGAPEAKRG